jgi:hypothetical protein
MSREPSYPEDAPVGTPPAEATDSKPQAGARRTKYLAAGAAIGIGSAAIVAALLYTNRGRRG